MSRNETAYDEIECAEKACRLRDQMDSIRSEMDEEVQDLRVETRRLFNWRRQFAAHPALWLGSAMALGVALSLRRKRSPTIQLDHKMLDELIERGQFQIEPKHPSLMRTARGAVGRIAMKAALNYAAQKILTPKQTSSVPSHSGAEHRHQSNGR